MTSSKLQPLAAPGLLLWLLLLGAYALTDMLPGGSIADGIDLDPAMGHVREVARERHPLGSDRNAEVRDYLVDQLSGWGLEVEVQRAPVVYDHPLRPERHVRAATVENVLARLPGRQQGPAVMLLSHYDSRPSGPGAGDAAAGVAAVLEAARSLSQGEPPERDVWFALTDGEEMGLLGAQALFRQHPLKERIGLVLNFEARGSAGPSMLFETGADNGDLLASMAEAITPVGTSMAYEVYRYMPNDTDLTIAKGEGLVGLNFAFADGYFDYHTERDTAANLSPASLAGHVDQATRLARHFAHLDALPEAAANQTYFNPVPGVLLRYGPGVALLLMVLAATATLVVLFARRKAWLSPWQDGLRSLLACLLTVALVGQLIGSLHAALAGQLSFGDARYWQLFYQYPRLLIAYGLLALAATCWLLAALARGLALRELNGIPLLIAALGFFAGQLDLGFILVLGLTAALLWWYRRPLDVERIRLSALSLWLILAGVSQVLVPSASFVIVLPLLWVAISQLVWASRPVIQDLLSVIGPVLIWAPMLYGLYLMLGVSAPQIPALVLALVLLLVASVSIRIASADRGVTVALAGAGGLAYLLIIATSFSFDGRHSQPSELFLAHNADSGERFWASSDPVLNDWTRPLLGEPAQQRPLADILPGAKSSLWFSAESAQAVELAPFEVLEDRIEGERRYLSLRIRSATGAEYVNWLFPPESTFYGAAIDGAPVRFPEDLGDEEWWRWRYYGMPENGVQLDLISPPDQPLSMRMVEVAYRWPEGLEPPPRPEPLMRRPYAWSDSTVTFRTLNVP